MAPFVRNLLVLAVLLLAGIAGLHAQSPAPSWTAVPVSADTVYVGSTGVVGRVDAAGAVSRREAGGTAWQVIGNAMSRVAVDPSGGVWAIDRTGAVLHFEGGQWRPVGQGAASIAAAPDGGIVVATDTGSLARYDPAKAAWTALSGSALRVAVDGRGLVWSVGSDGRIARRLGENWIGVAGSAKDIAADSRGNIVMAGTDGKVYEWIEDQARWNEIAGASTAASVAVGAGQLWRADADGKLYVRGIRTRAEQATNDATERRRFFRGTTNQATVADVSPLEFIKVGTGVVELSIGIEGSVFGLTDAGGLSQWSNEQRRFNPFPGTFKRIGVDAAGLPYGIGANYAFVRHDGEGWRAIRTGFAVIDLSLVEDTQALAVDQGSQLYRLDIAGEQATRGARLNANIDRIWSARDGSYWYRNTGDLLFRCDRTGTCLRFPARAADLAIGPGGTTFIVDEQGNLLRVTRGAELPEIVRRGTTSRVAVGPNDRPWIIEKNGDVMASRQFPRDESLDIPFARASERTAAATLTDPTNGAPATEVTFNQYRFLPVDVPTSAPGYPNLGSGLLDLTVGLDDQIIVSGYDASADPCNAKTSGWKGRNWLYSPQQRRFVHLDALKGVQYQVALAGRTTTFGQALPQIAGAPAVPAFYGSLRACERYFTVEYDAAIFAGSSDLYTMGGLDIARSSLTSREVPTSTRDRTSVVDMDITLDGTLVVIFLERKIQFIKLGSAYPGPVVNGEFPARADRKWARVSVGATADTLWATDVDNDVYEFVKATNTFEKRNLFANDRAQDIGVGKDGSVFIVDFAGRLKKWNPALRNFIATGRAGVTRVAVTSKGKPVVANFPASQRVYIAQ